MIVVLLHDEIYVISVDVKLHLGTQNGQINTSIFAKDILRVFDFQSFSTKKNLNKLHFWILSIL